MKNNPAFWFYPGDWLRDTQLRLCDAATRGIWLDVLCFMHESAKLGQLTFPNKDKFRMIVQATEKEVDRFLEDAATNGFCNVLYGDDGSVTLQSRRMMKEEKKRRQSRESAQRFRDKGGGDPDRWTAIRVRILEMDDYTCAYCGKKARAVDHIIPRHNGGTEEDGNLVSCCKACNSKKGLRTPEKANMSFRRGFTRTSCKSNVKVTPPSFNGSSSKQERVSDSEKSHSQKSVDLTKVLALYNETCKSFPKARKTDPRAKAFLPSLRKYPDIEHWQEVFKKAEASDFLSGRSGKWTGCSFDWFRSEANRTKVIEGNYDNKRQQEAATPRRSGVDPIVAERRRLAEEREAGRMSATT